MIRRYSIASPLIRVNLRISKLLIVVNGKKVSVQVSAAVGDRVFAGWQASIGVGPVRTRSAESVDRSLRRISQRGPANRIGLHPAKSRRWTFDPTSSTAWAVTHDSRAFRAADLESELDAQARDPLHVPLRLVIKGDYLFMTFDHGLGDAHFANAVLALATGEESSACADWPRIDPNGGDVTAALRAAVRTHPREICRELIRVVRGRLDRDGKDDWNSVVKPLRRPAVVLASSAPYFSDALRRAAQSKCRSSIIAMIAMATSRTLKECGIELMPTVDISVDLRRYLPDGFQTLANFVSVVKVPTDSKFSPDLFHARLQEEMASHRRLVAYATRHMIPMVPRANGYGAAPVDRAQLSFTEALGPRLASEKYSWAESPDPQVWTATLPLHSANDITTVIGRTPDGGIHMTASFFSEVYDPETVRRALAAVLTDPAATAGVGWR